MLNLPKCVVPYVEQNAFHPVTSNRKICEGRTIPEFVCIDHTIWQKCRYIPCPEKHMPLHTPPRVSCIQPQTSQKYKVRGIYRKHSSSSRICSISWTSQNTPNPTSSQQYLTKYLCSHYEYVRRSAIRCLPVLCTNFVACLARNVLRTFRTGPRKYNTYCMLKISYSISIKSCRYCLLHVRVEQVHHID